MLETVFGLKGECEAEACRLQGMSLLLSESSRSIPHPKEMNHCALRFPYREWSLLALHAASHLRISSEEPRSRARAWAPIWAWALWGCHSLTRNMGVVRWRPWYRPALCADRTWMTWVPGSYPASICSVKTASRAWSRSWGRWPRFSGLSQIVSTKVSPVPLLPHNRSLPVS